MSSIDALPDPDAHLDALHLRLHREGILDDARRKREPFKTFEAAYNKLQSAVCSKADPDIIEQHRQAALAAAPAVLEALGDAPAPVVNDTTTNANDAPAPETRGATETTINVTVEAQETPTAPEPIVDVVPPPNPDIPHIGFDIHGLLRVRVADLKPNAVNATVFTSSLGLESIRELAEDITRRKLRNPIEVRPDLELVDGERRYRGLLLLRAEETYVRVVNGLDSQESVEGYVWDAFSSARKPDLIEMVNVYELGVKVLAHRHGRPRGRPSKKDRRDDDLFWTVEQVKTAAAKRAHFASEVIADRATSVVRRADADLLAKLMTGEVTISAAYAKLSKPKDAKKKAKPSEDKGSNAAKPSDAQAQTDATDTSDNGEQQAHEDENQPGAGASSAASSSNGATASSTSATSSGDKHANDDRPSADTTDTTAQQQQAERADAKPTASEATTTEAKPPAPKLTIKRLVTLTVEVAAKKPALAQDIIYRTAEAAGMEVVVLDAITREAVMELARLLGNKLDDLASNDYEDACDLLTGIVETLWESVNAHQPDNGETDDEYE